MECTKEVLTKLLIDENKTYQEVGKIFGITGNGIKKRATKLGVELPKRRVINENETFNKDKVRVPIYFCLNCNNEIKKYSSHFGKFCCHQCQHKYQYTEYIKNWKSGNFDGLQNNGFTISKHIRNYLFDKNNAKCENCSWGEVNVNTGLIPLQIHHIDGDCKNNSENNLQLLCPNCHSLTENYGSRNKNAVSGRSEYFRKNK